MFSFYAGLNSGKTIYKWVGSLPGRFWPTGTWGFKNTFISSSAWSYFAFFLNKCLLKQNPINKCMLGAWKEHFKSQSFSLPVGDTGKTDDWTLLCLVFQRVCQFSCKKRLGYIRGGKPCLVGACKHTKMLSCSSVPRVYFCLWYSCFSNLVQKYHKGKLWQLVAAFFGRGRLHGSDSHT